MTTLLTLNGQSKCIIPNDVKVIRAQLQDSTHLVVNGEKKPDYKVCKVVIYEVPLILHKGDRLEISDHVTANILVEMI